MARKIILSFFIFLFCISAIAQAQIAIENSVGEAPKTVNDLKNIEEKLPSAEDIGAIASTIKKIPAAYQSAKTQIANIVSYSQKFIQALKETSEKIKNDILKIKNYIGNKIGFVFKSLSEGDFNLLLT